MDTDELLRRLSATLRADVGPAVGDEYTRTQVFMASVILEKVARELALASTHADAEREEVADLHRGLADLLSGDRVPAEVSDAIARARSVGSVAALGPVIGALYHWGIDREPAAADALDRIRRVLRSDIDRRMAVAR